MKGIVAYDSVHGNTKQIAEAIAEQIRSEGHEAELINLHGGEKREASGDFLFVGSPTRVGRATGEAKGFLDHIEVNSWKSKPMVAFDTVDPLSKDEDKRDKWLERVDEGAKNAAKQLQGLARRRGLNVYPKVLHSAVTGFLGPLAPDAVTRAKEFTHQFLDNLK